MAGEVFLLHVLPTHKENQLTVYGPPMDCKCSNLAFFLSTMYMIFSLITNFSGPTSAKRISWDTTLNTSIVSHDPRLDLMIQTFVRNTSSGALRNMDVKTLSMTFKLSLSFYQQQQESKDLRNEIIHLYASLATKIERIQLEVDKFRSQFFTGSVPWSSSIQVHYDRIDYW